MCGISYLWEVLEPEATTNNEGALYGEMIGAAQAMLVIKRLVPHFTCIQPSMKWSLEKFI